MARLGCNRLVFRGRLVFCFAIALASIGLATATQVFAQRDLKEIPDPDPELERKTFIVPEGFEVSLWAGDPMMAKPIHMNFDERGRLWIASSEVYPHIKPGEKAHDKILVLEDTDHDGRADKTTVFADGLLIPTGVAPGDGGVYVANSTDLIHLSDTDGDGKADQQRVVLSGFGTEDTHHLLHSLRWGHDGCLYMNQSIYIHSHVETPHGVKRLNGGGIWRFRPETMELDVHCYGFVNSWGLHFDHWGQSFATDGAYGEGINYVFPGSVFFTAVGAKRILSGLNPGSPKHCGLEILSGRHLPDDWSGSMITNDFRAHRVCRFVVTEDGSGYASRQEVEVIKSTHPAFRPIDVKMGPDGAIYIADWYNPIIQHGEVDFRDPRRDHVHGRIWRVSAKGRPALKPADFANSSPQELLELLKSPESWTRLHAKLAMKERNADEVVAAVEPWLAGQRAADADVEHHKLEALWALQAIDRVHPELLSQVLKSSDPRARAAGVRVLVEWMSRPGKVPDALSLLRSAVADAHPRVRLEAVRALAVSPRYLTGLGTELENNPAAIALTVLDKPMDRFLDFALWQAMRDLEPIWLPAVREGRLDFGGNVEHLTFALKAVESPGVVQPLLALIRSNKIPAERSDGVLTLVASLGGAEELGAVFGMVSDAQSPLPPATRAALLGSLVETSQRRKLKPNGDLGRLDGLLNSEEPRLQAAAARAIGAWKVEPLRTALVTRAQDANAVEAARIAALEALGDLGGDENAKLLESLAGAGKPSRLAAVQALAKMNSAAAAKLSVDLLAELSTSEQIGSLLMPILQARNGVAALTAALEGRKLSPDVAKLVLRTVQASPVQSPELLATIQKAGGLSIGGWKMTPEQVDGFVKEVSVKGDPHRGEAIYRRAQLQCQKCHAIGGAGGRVGPDLLSIGASAPVDYLVDSLIEPNKKVKENYHSVVVQTDDGKVMTGIPIRESKTELVLRDADDQARVIPTEVIEERKEGRSLMPDGAVDALTRDELVDLVRFLSELGKVGPFSVGQARVVRRWQSLVFSKESHHILNRSSYDTVATEKPEFVWQPVYSEVGGGLPVGDLPSFVVHPSHPKTTFLRFQVEVSTAGEVGFRFDSPKGVALWIDGKPTPVVTDVIAKLESGTHTLTMSVDQDSRKEPLRVELIDVTGSTARVQIVSGK